jgi:hypothetical protein
MRIDVAVLVENERRIFGRAREGNLGSRQIFLSWRAAKKLLAGRYLPTPGLDNRLTDGDVVVIHTHRPRFSPWEDSW